MSEMNRDRGPGSGVRGPDTQVLAEVDRQLRAALSVSPSADFEARVLQRVEGDRPVRFGTFGASRALDVAGRGLKTPALLAAASIVLVAGLFYAVTRTPAIQPAPAPDVAEHRPPVVEPPTAPVRLAKDVAPAHVAAAGIHVDVPRGRPEPDVIVPLNQMEAVRRLVRAVNEGRIEAPLEPPQGPMVPPAELAVAPLVVEPIPIRALDPEAGGSSPEIRRSY